jgi:hypothetical protein
MVARVSAGMEPDRQPLSGRVAKATTATAVTRKGREFVRTRLMPVSLVFVKSRASLVSVVECAMNECLTPHHEDC